MGCALEKLRVAICVYYKESSVHQTYPGRDNLTTVLKVIDYHLHALQPNCDAERVKMIGRTRIKKANANKNL